MIKADVETKAMEILDEFQLNEVPVPVRRVAESAGLNVRPYDLGENISGVLITNDGNATIGFDPRESSVRRRFTIAHELGHYFLHLEDKSKDELFVDKQFKVYFRDENSSTGEIFKEQQANAFAAALLMPKNKLVNSIEQEDFDLTDEDAIASLAKKFNVSSLAMTYRISNLGLI